MNETRLDLDALITRGKDMASMDRYELIGWRVDVTAALAAERERAERAEARIADAWDEGYIAVPAEPEDREAFVEDAPNPYRSEATA